jgi:transposase-like protein
MAMRVENTKLHEAVELITERDFAGVAEVMQILCNEAMRIERNRYLQAQPYERSEQRQDYANGFKPKQLKTSVGSLALQVPQVRSSQFYPSFLEKGIRSERALKVALAEMYVQGVSTRKVNVILEELCGLEISSTEVSNVVNFIYNKMLKPMSKKSREKVKWQKRYALFSTQKIWQKPNDY